MGGGQFDPESGGHFGPECPGHFKSESGGQFERNLQSAFASFVLYLSLLKDLGYSSFVTTKLHRYQAVVLPKWRSGHFQAILQTS